MHSSPIVLQFKVVLLGDSGVGKSSLLTRFVTDSFSDQREATMGASFMSKQINLGDNKVLKFNIWDTAGQERYHSLAKMYYRDAAVAILVFDLIRPESLQSLKRWHQELREHGPKDIILAIAANKEDLCPTDNQEGLKLAKEFGAIYKRTSAKTSIGVEQLFREVAAKLSDIGLSTQALATPGKRRVSAVIVKPPIELNQGKKRCCGGQPKGS